MTDSPNLGLPFIEGAQAQKHVTHNEALRYLDTLVQLAVLDRDLNAPPGSPAEGQRWIIKASPAPTGAWASHGNHIAAWQDGAWQFSIPKTGWTAFVVDETLLATWNGSAWVATISAIQNIPIFGVNTTADTTNRLAVKSDAILFNQDDVTPGSGDIRIKVNKSAAAKTASYLFQDNASGRAEVGLTGDDDFHFKVSADGTSWVDALILDKTTGAAKLYSGVHFASDLSPTQITADQNDYNPTGLATTSVLRLSSDAARNITGLSGGSDGRILIVLNVGANAITLKNESASSSAANRFSIGSDITITANQGAHFIYDATSSRWRAVAVFTSAGGSGFLVAANNLSDLASAATARTNLGLGTAATANTGTSGGTLPLLNGANTWSGAQAIAAKLDAQQDVYLSGDISPSQITADQNDYNPSGLAGAAVLRLSSDATRNITGLQGGADGRLIKIINVGSNNIVLKDASTSSSAANRFALGADITLVASQSCALWYDSTSSRWRAVGVSHALPLPEASGGTGGGAFATASEIRANTAGKVLATDDVWSAADLVSLTDGATITPDFSTGFNFTVTLAGNRTLANPTNTKNGQTGVIEIKQDGTGSRTLAYGSNWKFAGGTAPTLTTAANARDLLLYFVISSSVIYGTLIKDVK